MSWRIPLRYRHPYRWRRCVRIAEELSYGRLGFTPGQIYHLLYNVRLWETPPEQRRQHRDYPES